MPWDIFDEVVPNPVRVTRRRFLNVLIERAEQLERSESAWWWRRLGLVAPDLWRGDILRSLYMDELDRLLDRQGLIYQQHVAWTWSTVPKPVTVEDAIAVTKYIARMR